MLVLVLLPPSETKRPGGDGAVFDPAGLRFEELLEPRRLVTRALIALSRDPETARRVLKLGVRNLGDIAVNAALDAAPTVPALARYTGVLYDALDAPSLRPEGWEWAREHLLIQTAPWGPVAATDPLPAYRLAAGVSLPGVGALRRVWAEPGTRALGSAGARFVLDLRSRAYVALSPVPADLPSAWVEVVTAEEGGGVRALNHFNKTAKGMFVRALLDDAPSVRGPGDLIDWASGRGIALHGTPARDPWRLVVPD